MARSVRRRKKQRIYWVEIGFLILGLIALRPSLVTDLVAMGRPVPAIQAPAYDSHAVGFRSYYPNWNQAANPPAYQPAYPSAYPSAYQPAWQSNPNLTTPSSTTPSSNVAWPNAQVHQWIHQGEMAPHVAVPMRNYSIPNGRY